jgi:hypothetical protein
MSGHGRAGYATYRLLEQHGCGEKPLEQSVVQFLRDARTLFTTFFQTDITFELRLSQAGHLASSMERCSRSSTVPSHLSGIKAALGETIGVDGARGRAGIQVRMSG